MTTLYLNNSGSRWIVALGRSDFDRCLESFKPSHSWKLDRSPMDFMLVLPDGSMRKRRADCYAQFGNFATVEFRISGVRHGGFFDSFAKIDGLPVLRRYNKRGVLEIVDTTNALTDKDLELLGAYK